MTDIPNSKGAPPPPTPGRRSALHPGSFSLHAQRKGTKRNAPRRPARDFVPEADPTPASAALPPQVARALRATGPQRPTGRIGQGQPRYRPKIVLETPQRGVEKPKPRITPKRTNLDSDTSLSFTESGGFAGLAKRCVVSVDSIPRKAKAGVAVVRRLKEILVPPSRGRDLMVYRLRLKGPKGEKLIHFDERTVPAKARSLIAFLSDQAHPVDSV